MFWKTAKSCIAVAIMAFKHQGSRRYHGPEKCRRACSLNSYDFVHDFEGKKARSVLQHGAVSGAEDETMDMSRTTRELPLSA